MAVVAGGGLRTDKMTATPMSTPANINVKTTGQYFRTEVSLLGSIEDRGLP
jgi:hypothetical protein